MENGFAIATSSVALPLGGFIYQSKRYHYLMNFLFCVFGFHVWLNFGSDYTCSFLPIVKISCRFPVSVLIGINKYKNDRSFVERDTQLLKNCTLFDHVNFKLVVLPVDFTWQWVNVKRQTAKGEMWESDE